MRDDCAVSRTHRAGEREGALVFVNTISGPRNPNSRQNRHQYLANLRHLWLNTVCLLADTHACPPGFFGPRSWNTVRFRSLTAPFFLSVSPQWEAAAAEDPVCFIRGQGRCTHSHCTHYSRKCLTAKSLKCAHNISIFDIKCKYAHLCDVFNARVKWLMYRSNLGVTNAFFRASSLRRNYKRYCEFSCILCVTVIWKPW